MILISELEVRESSDGLFQNIQKLNWGKKLLMERRAVTSPSVEKFLAKLGTRIMSQFFVWLIIENTIDFVKVQSENVVI